jgi:uncharacterized SAM-binding protein YcdF (DUF218 family)
VARRLAFVLAGLVLAWLVLCATLFVWPHEGGLPERADAVVVLSGGLNARLDPALKLMHTGIAPVLAVSSAFRDEHWKKAQRLCRGDLGPTRYDVLCFTARPYSTVGEAEVVGKLARRNGWHRIVVVTSTYHVTRARMLFRRCYDGGISFVGTGSPWWRLPEEWAYETGKLAVQLTVRRGC